MKLKLNAVLLFAYLVIISIILKKILFVPILVTVLLFFLNKYLPSELENILYLAVAILPFMPLLAIFIFYLPFAVYGFLLESSNFTKRYLFGYTISFFSAIFIYILSVLDFKINRFLIILAFYLPVLIVAFKLYRKNKTFNIFKEIYKIEAKEFAVLLISLFFLFFVTHNIINNHNLYMSNGTYVYTKFLSVVEGVKELNSVPQYEPRIGQGEQLFHTDTPVFYSNLGFVNIVLGWIPSVLLFNSITVFIAWLSILGLWLFMREMLPGEKNDYVSFIVPIVASLSVVLSFMFLQLFESFKQSSTYPINFLALSLIFSVPKKPKILLSILALFILSFLIHGTQFIGFVQLAFFSFLILILQNNPKEQINSFLEYSKKNKLKLITLFFLIILILAIPLFYLVPGQMYKSYMRVPYSLETELNLKQIKTTVPDYLFRGLFLDKNTNPLSVKYPDLRRIDDKKFGFFFSFFGVMCFLFVLFNFRKSAFKKTAAFSFAYLLHFVFSSFLVVITFFNSIEYGYRTVLPFMLVVFLASIAAAICSLQSKNMRLIFLAILFAAFFHASFHVKQNLNNIHAESIIAGETFAREIDFIKQLPRDGRIITFGMYSNAVDMAMAALTDRYFSRYGFLQWSFKDNIYEKLTRMNSFGVFDAIEPLTSNELANYLRLGGYKYVFLNICHPVGLAVLNKLFPDNAYPMYQNQNYQCFVVLGVNNSNYAEKIDLVKDIDEKRYKDKDAYKFVTLTRNKQIYDFDITQFLSYTVENPRKPEPLLFTRDSSTQVKISGNFKNNDWVVFKEEHFPRWKAYMNNKEVPLLATNYRMMLIKTANGDSITLQYSLQPKEKFAALLSLIALVLLFLIFVFVI